MRFVILCLTLGIVLTTGLLLRVASSSSAACETPVCDQSAGADSIATDGQSDEPIELLQLEDRDRIITVKSGPNGRLYTVETLDGEIVLQNVSAEQLQAVLPEAFDGLDSYRADIWRADAWRARRYTGQFDRRD